MPCKHERFEATVSVGRLLSRQPDDDQAVRFMADVRVKCVECGTPFSFIGLPAGSDINSPMVSVDGTEGRFPIHPRGETLTVLEGPSFTVRKRGK